jgi:protein-S-isoprenylcysteine O-methyltransferase Ste14
MSASTPAPQPLGKTDSGRVIHKWLFWSFAGTLMIIAMLFIAAGRLDWPMGWVFVGVYVIVALVPVLTGDPGMLRERFGTRPDEKRWDRQFVKLNGLLLLGAQVLAALDLRFGWPPEIPLAIQIVALVIYLLGWGLHLWAMAANRFFSKIIRIQRDRGHTVVTGGPYRYVRHTGYTGAILSQLATAPALGSLWALIPGALAALVLVVRTALEDRTLQEELEGYKDYAQRVRYRLLPGVW